MKQKNEKGMVLVVVIMLLATLTILGTAAFMQTATDLKISGKYKTNEEAFFAAETGIEEARARLRKNASSPLIDGHPAAAQWVAYIGTDTKAHNKGWDSGNPMHLKLASLQTALNYVVIVRHQTDSWGNILYWGDQDGDGICERNISKGKNIYIVTSFGSSGLSTAVIEAEMTRLPPIESPAALYVEAVTAIQGTSTHVIGTDGCGISDKPGIVTTGAVGSIGFSGNPTVSGSPNDIEYNATDINIQAIVDSFKDMADFTYEVAGATHTGSAVPGPGDGWGTPAAGATQQDPSSCACNTIVHYDTHNTDIKLSGGVTGCGILLVEGDLDMHGDFFWYGIVIATGSVRFTGGGNKNLTGSLLAGGSVDADIIGGNSNIIYCSDAVNDQTENRPLRILSWKELR
ncbi:MAG: pilus assembly PilX N-terminal domain-containing protein [Syntrophales bacterium]|jgi:hypothetical protein|nr:pilus assembly PilX N-terminal domain-containing protein [Syntrophales bacterium]